MPAKGGPKSEVCKGRDGPLNGEGSRRMTTHSQRRRHYQCPHYGSAETTHMYFNKSK